MTTPACMECGIPDWPEGLDDWARIQRLKWDLKQGHARNRWYITQRRRRLIRRFLTVLTLRRHTQ